MGGVLINGCGAADSFYVLRVFPGKKCRSCGRGDYALMEVKRKIRVFYIPTVPLNTKYGVCCTKCKSGYYVSEEMKSIILTCDPDDVAVASDGVIVRMPDEAPQIPPAEAESRTASDPEPKPQSQFCIGCGAELTSGARFCNKCGTQVMENALPTPAEPDPDPVVVPEESDTIVFPMEPEESDTIVFPMEPEPVVISEEPEQEKPPLPLPDFRDKASSAEKRAAAPLQLPNYQRGRVCPDCGIRAFAGKTHCSICGAELK